MWKSIGALVARAGEALGIEIPEIPGITALGDTVEAASGQAGQVITDATANVGDTVAGTADQAAGAVAALRDKVTS